MNQLHRVSQPHLLISPTGHGYLGMIFPRVSHVAELRNTSLCFVLGTHKVIQITFFFFSFLLVPEVGSEPSNALDNY